MRDAFDGLGFYPADILLPQNCDLSRWSVVACDQYTAQPDYWERVDRFVGDAPSTLRLILPESRLGGEKVDADIAAINAEMERYVKEDRFTELGGSMIYLERRLKNGRVRRGLVGMADLEAYDYRPGSQSLIRATEGTVLSRIPPRVRVREGAILELPHVMLLCDDPERTVIETLAGRTADMTCVYDFDLMEDGGHITGWALGEKELNMVAGALRALADPTAFQARYNAPGKPPLLFAVGDGNHSLATAKTCYEQDKGNEKARYALVELVNLHDEALEFEPIHRVVFGVEPRALLEALLAYYPGAALGAGEGHRLPYVYAGGEGVVTVPHPAMQLEVGTLQTFLDDYLPTVGGKIDYIHGEDVTRRLACQPGNMGFLLPAMEKKSLFPTVLFDGALPRKTFSMGEAHDKRFYLEARRIR